MDKTPKKVLVVEDEPSLRNALSDKFTREDFDVLEAKNGKEGLEIALKEHPDLILLDIIMPVMDGISMLKQLRNENEWGKHVPVIILTNLINMNEAQHWNVTELEPSFYLIKTDWKIEDLVTKIREHLGT